MKTRNPCWKSRSAQEKGFIVLAGRSFCYRDGKDSGGRDLPAAGAEKGCPPAGGDLGELGSWREGPVMMFDVGVRGLAPLQNGWGRGICDFLKAASAWWGGAQTVGVDPREIWSGRWRASGGQASIPTDFFGDRCWEEERGVICKGGLCRPKRSNQKLRVGWSW